MISKILNKISLKENRRRYLNLKGIANKRYAYKGPDVVQVDLINRCNSNCIACWTHSTTVDRNKEENSAYLDFSALSSFLRDLSKLETTEIIFSGGGEPFLYPKIFEVLELVQKLGLNFRLNTNFTLLGRDEILKLLSFNKLASVTASIWAGEPFSYSKIHNRHLDYFYKVKDNLTFFNISKSRKIIVKMYAVINNVNYVKFKSLVDYAIETKCDGIEFGVMDAIPGLTDYLLLNKEQVNFVQKNFIEILKYLKSKKTCLKVVNREVFLRRISNNKAYLGEYDSFLDRIPCYAGWTFLRLRANGDFNSCLKSHRIPIGNIYKENIALAWNNSYQQQFRIKSLAMPRDKGYFSFIGNCNDGEIGCKRICDNMLVNINLHKITKYLFLSNAF